MSIVESELVARVKRDRDMVAFRDLVLMHQRRVYALVRRIAQSHEEAEDLVQDTFLKSLREIDRIRDDSRFGPWISTMAVRLALDGRRRHTRAKPVSVEEPAQQVAVEAEAAKDQRTPFDRLQQGEMRARIDAALGKLPERQQAAFLLYHEGGLTLREIAEVNGTTVSTITTRVFRAVRHLRAELKNYHQAQKE